MPQTLTIFFLFDPLMAHRGLACYWLAWRRRRAQQLQTFLQSIRDLLDFLYIIWLTLGVYLTNVERWKTDGFIRLSFGVLLIDFGDYIVEM